MDKALYFDNDGIAHDAFVVKTKGDTAEIIYHPKPAKRLWDYNTETQNKWKKLNGVVHKDKAEKIIHVEKDSAGNPIENIRGIKNCYKIVTV